MPACTLDVRFDRRRARRSVKLLACCDRRDRRRACGGDDDKADASRTTAIEDSGRRTGTSTASPRTSTTSAAIRPTSAEPRASSSRPRTRPVSSASMPRKQDDSSPVDLGASCLCGNVGGEELGTVSHLLQVRVFDGEQFYGADDVPTTSSRSTVSATRPRSCDAGARRARRRRGAVRPRRRDRVDRLLDA